MYKKLRKEILEDFDKSYNIELDKEKILQEAYITDNRENNILSFLKIRKHNRILKLMVCILLVCCVGIGVMNYVMNIKENDEQKDSYMLFREDLKNKAGENIEFESKSIDCDDYYIEIVRFVTEDNKYSYHYYFEKKKEIKYILKINNVSEKNNSSIYDFLNETTIDEQFIVNIEIQIDDNVCKHKFIFS